MTPLNPRSSRATDGRVPAAFVLLLTLALALIWSHYRLMWNDEFLSFYTDSVPSAARVIAVQLHHPISLDPPTYHLLSHLSMDIFGANAMSLRLPALAGFLLLQVSLFLFVRRLAGPRAGVVAMALPLLTASFRYAVEGRPYGLLLGLYGLSLLCWQRAAESNDRRLLPLAGLTLAIAAAITSHYFGVLILLPVCIGELARIRERRSLDFGIIAALTVGLGSVALILPFQKALMVYRVHYYIAGVNWHNITQGYRELFIRYTTWPLPLQKVAAAAMAAATIALAVAGYRRFKRRPHDEPAFLWAGVAATALLPFFGYLFGRFVTHTMEVRYVIAALIAFAVTAAVLMERRLQNRSFYYGTLTVIVLAAIGLQGTAIAGERRDTAKMMASFQVSSQAQAELSRDPSKRIYTQSLNDFFLNSYYAPQIDLRSRFSLVYDQNREIAWLGHDTNYITALNLQHFSALSTTAYDAVLRQPNALVVFNYTGWEWIDKELAARHLPQTPEGDMMRGKLVRLGNGAVR